MAICDLSFSFLSRLTFLIYSKPYSYFAKSYIIIFIEHSVPSQICVL